MARTTHTGNGNRTPVPVKVGRSFGDVLKAFLAFIALALLVGGVPFSLAYFIGWPLPREVPSLDMLSQEISTGVFLKVLGVLVWIAWAQFTACVLVEVKAALSGVGMPTRVPGAGPSQLLARQLVGALLLLGTAAASFTPGLSSIGNAFDSPQAPMVAEAEQTPGQERAERAAGPSQAEPAMAIPEEESASSAEEAEAPTKYYRIQPPDGRHHDTLWGISERHLDDGLRYKEIYQLNKDRVQPDGSKLTEASLIRPGWILEMPADAQGGELVEMPYDLEELTEEEVDEFEEYQETGDTEWADPAPQPDPVPDKGGTDVDLALPGLPGGYTDPADGAFDTSGGTDVSEAQEEGPSGLFAALMAAPLMAAGLLAALGRSRRNALWQAAAGTLRRSLGDDLEPQGATGENVRDSLLAGADPEAVAFLDRALRLLSAELDGAGRTLPAVYAAWLSDTELHLQLAAPAGNPPAPWQPGQSETYWTLDRTALPEGAGDQASAEAPYPGLVSLGTRDDIRLLLNLEAVPGIVSVLGAARDREAVLASVAAELATSGWSDRMTVTLVGFGEDLPLLAPTRVRYLEDVGGLLEVMETETSLRHSNLQHTGQDSVLSGRTGPARQHQWAPHLVIIGVEPTEDEADRLGGLASVSAPLGIGYLVTSNRPDLPGIAWEFEITEDGELKEPDMGLELTAQLLPARQRRAVVKLFSELAADGGESAEGQGPAPAYLVELGAGSRPEVYAELMGGYKLTGLPDPEPERAAQLREALALLMLHRTGVHPRVLATALWPRGVSEDVRDAFIGRLREWLGTETTGGGPRLLIAADDGRLSLSPRVISDWDVLRTLHHQALAAPRPGLGAAERKRQLTDALALAQGALLAEQRTDGRFEWLQHEIVDAQYPLLVAEIALALSGEHLKAQEGEPAYLAVRSALGAAPSDERLWNELLRSAHATGRAEWLAGAAQWLVAHHRQLFGEQQLPAETEALLDELLPSWREKAAVG